MMPYRPDIALIIGMIALAICFIFSKGSGPSGPRNNRKE